MDFFDQYLKEQISTGVLIVVFIFSRTVVSKLVRRYAKTSQIIERRTNLVIKYINILITILTLITLILIWGVQAEDIFITISSVATVIGVAMFAQWFTAALVRTKVGKRMSERNRELFPFGYFLVAVKPE